MLRQIAASVLLGVIVVVASCTPAAQLPAAAPSAFAMATPQANQVGFWPVVAVVDGDTIKVAVAGRTETVRVLGIDTPEVVDPRKPVQCYGREASAKAKELLEGQAVRLDGDETQADRDKYDRLLRYVEKTGGADFGLWLLANGYAHEYTYDIPYKRQARYKAAETRAREQQIGLWAANTCNGDTSRPAR